MTPKNKQYKATALYNKKQAQIIGERIEFLMDLNNGEVKPLDLVKDAKKISSPLHYLFEWDDFKAGHNYRIKQAQFMINHIIEVVVIDKKQKEVRSFFNVKNRQQENVYVTLKTATTKPNYTRQLIADCIRYINHFTDLLQLLKSNIK